MYPLTFSKNKLYPDNYNFKTNNMKFSESLKRQFVDFVEVYRNYFGRTLAITFACSVLCIVSVAIFLRFSDFDLSNKTKQISLLSYFFRFYSRGDTYSLVDLTKSVFIFFVAIFSVSLIRIEITGDKRKEISLGAFIKNITLKDFASLIGVLLVVSLIDFALVKISGLLSSDTTIVPSNRLFNGVLYELRVYIPLILFSLTIYALTTQQKVQLSLKRILVLLISLWVLNVIAYEFTAWIRAYVFGLILLPFSDTERFYFLESFLGIPLITIYFLGYYSAMTNALKRNE
jgi:hypothetical protein